MSEVHTMRGVVKSFFPRRRFGFIELQDGHGDALVLQTDLAAAGYYRARQGASALCEVARRPRGWRVVKLLHLDDADLKPLHTVEPVSDWIWVTCKWFSREKGYGFWWDEHGSDIYVHKKDLRRFGIKDILPGEAMLIRWGLGESGRVMADLRMDVDPAE